MKTDIKEILAIDPDAQVAALNRLTDARLAERPTGLVFFGAGHLGGIALRNAKAAGLIVRAIADNNSRRWGDSFHGVPIISPAEAVAKFGSDHLFVITVYTGAPVWTQLRNAAVEPLSFAQLAWRYPEHFLPHASVELPHRIFAERDQVLAASEIWADDLSRALFAEQVAWRATLRPEVLSAHSPTVETYFADDLFNLGAEEVYVDCGAFDGDSIRHFLAKTNSKFRKIIGIEPDTKNCARLKQSCSAITAENPAALEVLPFAVGDRSQTLCFDETGTAASSIGSGTLQVQCEPLDNLITDTVTYLKMDIEGAEPAALRGAARLISRDKPILAICVYHQINHVWEIPLYLKQIAPSYRLALRRYSDECWELVCFAVPPSRWKQSSH